MIRTIIIDDELHCIDRLSRLIEEHCGEHLALEETFSTVKDGIYGMRKLHPDLVFLDIQIHEKTGFDLLEATRDMDFDVIFTTAFEKYAVQAFKFSAVDYLLKPVEADELVRAVSRLEKRIKTQAVSAQLEALLHNIKNPRNETKKIAVPTSGGLIFIPVNEIIRCQSNINYTTLFLIDDRKITVARTLKEFELLLADYNFFRIHNSHLVNLSFISSYKKGKGGTVIMSDQSELDVSTRRKDDLLKRLSK